MSPAGLSFQSRRGFLKLAASVVGALSLARYAEPILAIADRHHDWIEDKGDYLIVRVPDFKTFANETLNKPVIFLLGQEATVHHVEVNAFSNVHSPKGGRIYGSRFDGSQMETEMPRPLVVIKGGDGLVIENCNMIGVGHQAAIDLYHLKSKPQISHVYSIGLSGQQGGRA